MQGLVLSGLLVGLCAGYFDNLHRNADLRHAFIRNKSHHPPNISPTRNNPLHVQRRFYWSDGELVRTVIGQHRHASDVKNEPSADSSGPQCLTLICAVSSSTASDTVENSPSNLRSELRCFVFDNSGQPTCGPERSIRNDEEEK
jgi:hypothetical protein